MAALEERVQPGTQVDVVDRQGRILRGEFVRADDEGILVSLYRAPTERLSWSVVPHPVPRGAGVRVALAF